MDIAIIVLLSILIVLQLIIILKKDKGSIKEDIISSLITTKDDINKNVSEKITESINIQQNQLTSLTTLNENKLENVRKTVEEKLTQIQKENSEKLEQMRVTVDEKLHKTLEQRLGESFKLVNDRLESVYKGLGEMQTLAQGVGDLKKVFTNVKSRGYWGEIQLSNILDQFLTKDQYVLNKNTIPNSKEFVEFAIKLPGKNDNEYVFLPVDSKFPIEDFQKLIEAEDQGNIDLINENRKKLLSAVSKFAKDIHDKYIEPPYTTDFGIMFLPTESLYCEVLKNSTICEEISQKYRVVISGPTTFIALLNSLQMGFRTLAIEKHSSEVWKLLGTVKSEFAKFGDLLDKTNKKLQEISNTMVLASRKTRTIETKLKNVDALPLENEKEFYMLDSNNQIEITEDDESTDENAKE
ncbi:MAG: DNA recombination protein RmuC [Clostridia bacterium]|nr:DNA recombination protein RmuC [Clostridia bacterium]